ncbi:serine/threonine protein kinase [Nakamurella lactea]|uniref:serine/threonine protein kinase n=1 Tax=Nakamurella lactea TaxID=459515 RepID=UPI0004205AE8|nr:serine/threonine-protein kinase [Nakamurella lactea]
MEIGGYRTERLIGQGAGADVWRAVAPDGSTVALKVFDGPYQAVLQAAKREASLAAQVDHPHLLRVSALVCDSDRVALALPLAAGGSLAELLGNRGRLRPAEVLTVLIPIASALATAHERGVVHGDLSPANIVFDAAGRPLLTDLGAARVALDCGIPVAATPGYVAPEVARGAEPDPAADVFGLGAVALHCLSGRPAWNADDLRDVVVQATVGQWPDPADDDGPAPLVAAIRAALLDVPQKRPGAASLVVDLSRSGAPEPVDLAADPPSPPVLPGPAPAAGRDDESVAQRRIRASRTRLRPDARRPDPAPAGGHRHAAGAVRGRWSAGHRWPAMRIVAVVVGLIVLGALAVQAGLIWAGAGHSAGSSAPPAGAATASARSAGAAPSATLSANGSPENGSSSTTSSTASSSRARSSTARSPTTTSTNTRSSKTGAPPSDSATPASDRAVAPTWSEVATSLDRARANALTRRDPALLNRVYTAGSSARKADAATISRLRDRGVRVSGAAHRILAVRLLADGATIRLEVTDLLPSYQVLDMQGAPIGVTPAREQGRRLLVLARTPDGFRIATVSEG